MRSRVCFRYGRIRSPTFQLENTMRFTRPGMLALSATLLACAPDAQRGAEDLFSPPLASQHAAAPCASFSAIGQTFAINDYTFQGSATVSIGGGAPMAAAVTTYLTGSIKKGNAAQGTQVVTTSHTFDFGSGDTFTTQDVARIVPTTTPGLFKLLSTLRIAAGTGSFAGVAERPNPPLAGDESSTMNFAVPQPVADWSVSGRICGFDS
jgi:hypothetical protein